MVRELATQLMQLQRTRAPVTPQPEQTSQAHPYAQQPTDDKKEMDDIDGEQLSDGGPYEVPLTKIAADKPKLLDTRPSKKPRLDMEGLSQCHHKEATDR